MGGESSKKEQSSEPGWPVQTLHCSLESKYTIADKLGIGVGGTTFLLRSKQDGSKFVAKRCHEASADSIRREAAVLRRLSHPNVVSLHSIFEGELPCFVCEYISSGDLEGRLKTSPPESWIARVFQQALQALAYLHGSGVVHNDVKPGNVLLRGSADTPIAVLTDFGTAMLLHEAGSMLLGDPRYQCPECWRLLDAYANPGKVPKELLPECSPAFDMWAAGVTLFELLSKGALPFLYRCSNDLGAFMSSDDFHELKAAVLGPSVLDVSALTSECSSLARMMVRELLHKEPSMRLTAGAAIQREWCQSKEDVFDRSGLTLTPLRDPVHSALLCGLARFLPWENRIACWQAHRCISNSSGLVPREAFIQFMMDLGHNGGRAAEVFSCAGLGRNDGLTFIEFIAASLDWAKLHHEVMNRSLGEFFQQIAGRDCELLSLEDFQGYFRSAVFTEPLVTALQGLGLPSATSRLRFRAFLFPEEPIAPLIPPDLQLETASPKSASTRISRLIIKPYQKVKGLPSPPKTPAVLLGSMLEGHGPVPGSGLASGQQDPDSSGQDLDGSLDSTAEEPNASRTCSSSASNGPSPSGAGRDRASKSDLEDAERSSDGGGPSEADGESQARFQNNADGALASDSGSDDLDQRRGGDGTSSLPSIAAEFAGDDESSCDPKACNEQYSMEVVKAAEQIKLDDELKAFFTSERRQMEIEKQKLVAELEAKHDESLREIRESSARELERPKAELRRSEQDGDSQRETSAEPQANSELTLARRELLVARAAAAQLGRELRALREQGSALSAERDEALRRPKGGEARPAELEVRFDGTRAPGAASSVGAGERGEPSTQDLDAAVGEAAVLRARAAELAAEGARLREERDAARAEALALRKQHAVLSGTAPLRQGERQWQSVSSQVQSLTRAVAAMRKVREMQESRIREMQARLDARASTAWSHGS